VDGVVVEKVLEVEPAGGEQQRFAARVVLRE